MAVTATGAVEAVGALSFTDMCLMEFSLVAVLGSGCPLYFSDVVLVASVTIVEVRMFGYLFFSIVVVAKIFWSITVLIFIFVVVIRGLTLFLLRLSGVAQTRLGMRRRQ